MAEQLRANGHDTKPPTNGPAPLSADEYLAFLQDYDDAESALMAAKAACKAPKKEFDAVKKDIAERTSLASFERARADRMKPGYQREEEDAAYRAMMAWLGKPVAIGEQSAFDFAGKEPETAELHAIDSEGYQAGRNGHAEDTNTWTPGTAQHASFASAHKRGFDEFMSEQAERAEAMGPDADAPKKRGRPAGSKNRPKADQPPA